MKYSLTLEVKYNHFPALAKKWPQEAADIQGHIVGMIIQIADPLTPVLTGNLKNNKQIDFGGIGKAGFVHWLAPYTGYVVFGTRHMAARPFIQTAVAQVQPIFEQAIEKMLEQGV